MYCGLPDQLPSCLLDLNWDQTMDTAGHFESVLSSIAPPSQSSGSPASADGVAFHKLMGGSQSIGNSSDGTWPRSHHIGVRLNSPPKPNLSVLGHIRHLQQEATGGVAVSTQLDQFYSFGGRNYGHLAPQFGLLDTLQMELPLRLNANNGELMNAREESSLSDPTTRGVSSGGAARSNSKKRKAPPTDKVKGDAILANSAIDPPKVAKEEDSDAKRCRSMVKNRDENDAVKPKAEQNDGCSSNGNGGQKQCRENTAKSTEPPKDYIHVRARRGQATDSHSLAERVRREKISQRMKLLQDLVPGCNKVTGKAVMLDEIIIYVQSLQRQVEFLSMKLATVNPHLDFNNLSNLLPKDVHQTCGAMPNSVYSLEASGVAPPYINQPSLHCVLPDGMEIHRSADLLGSTLHQNVNTHQPLLAGFENSPSQLGNFWEDGLQNVSQMDIGHD
ncbi:unnamed protein product [Musa acuminata subsp. malaccensis]|uniref:(wild Malaysian banana) hypothetical protein n=1 Tax=Musa acuminata subsp. malaccensis TaxID=214687 RepID=A0A804L1G3_MUSAM|nr:PREDICTED: transcription factor bHLH77-like [Musa acuminata subsp. malaccensis]CAG1854905.1 unnamed protein product [Musa acuminata subsp. malaccensis]